MPRQKTEEGRKKALANLKPFHGYADCITDEEREKVRLNSQKGGKATQEVLKKARTMKEVTEEVLKIKVNREKAVTYLGDDVDLVMFDENGLAEFQEVLAIRAARIASDGNIKALEFIRDTSGQRPTSEVNISADLIMTEADKRLIDKITARLNGEK